MACQLVADVGNTETVFGLLDLDGREVLGHWRVSTRVPRTEAEYGVLLRALLSAGPGAGPGAGPDAGPQPAPAVRRGVIGSVVPSGDRTLRRVMSSLVDGAVFNVSARSDLPIRLDVEEPLTVGADRIVNTLAAKVRFGRDTIAVDLGTATTFDCITADGIFRGGVIAPGLSAGLDWLARSTAKLPNGGTRSARRSGGPPHRDLYPEWGLLLGGGRGGRDRAPYQGELGDRGSPGRGYRRLCLGGRPPRGHGGSDRTVPDAGGAGDRGRSPGSLKPGCRPGPRRLGADIRWPNLGP